MAHRDKSPVRELLPRLGPSEPSFFPYGNFFITENTKATTGRCKLPLELIPRIALVQEAAVLVLGTDCPAKAYGS